MQGMQIGALDLRQLCGGDDQVGQTDAGPQITRLAPVPVPGLALPFGPAGMLGDPEADILGRDAALLGIGNGLAEMVDAVGDRRTIGLAVIVKVLGKFGDATVLQPLGQRRVVLRGVDAPVGLGVEVGHHGHEARLGIDLAHGGHDGLGTVHVQVGGPLLLEAVQLVAQFPAHDRHLALADVPDQVGSLAGELVDVGQPVDVTLQVEHVPDLAIDLAHEIQVLIDPELDARQLDPVVDADRLARGDLAHRGLPAVVVGGGATGIAIDRPREVLLQEARDLGAHLLPLGIPERELELAVFQVEAEILGPHALDDLVGNHERQTVCTLVDRHRLAVAAGRYGGLAADKGQPEHQGQGKPAQGFDIRFWHDDDPRGEGGSRGRRSGRTGRRRSPDDDAGMDTMGACAPCRKAGCCHAAMPSPVKKCTGRLSGSVLPRMAPGHEQPPIVRR